MTTPRRPYPLWPNTRTSSAAYADEALTELRGAVRLPTARLRGYVRDALLLAFEAGETQGEDRAIRVLAVARENAQSEEARTAIDAALRVLVGE